MGIARRRKLGGCRPAGGWLWSSVFTVILPAAADVGSSVSGLADLSLEALSNLQVTSVSKAPEGLRSAPAAIYVITRDDIMRAGITTIAEALRLAPNLLVSQYSASNYIVGARGFGGAQEAQNFSNKLLMLIDGRSVYTPLYSGIYLDVQDVLIEDIDRIEVISGPGATLWGANAVNGVINVITRPAYLTDGGVIKGGSGNRDRRVGARYGGKLAETLSYRFYGKVFKRDAEALADGSALDAWEKAQGGFRADWAGVADSLTAQGDFYRANQSQPDADDQKLLGGNLLARWEHRGSSGDWQLQSYYDYTERAQPPGGSAFTLSSFDLQLQHSTTIADHRIVWGTGGRVHRYRISDGVGLKFSPNERSLLLANVFVQDTIPLFADIDLTLGLKLERNPYAGVTPLPDLRLAWRISDQQLLWASASRAIRSPTPFDRDVIEVVGDTVFLTGNRDFDPERVDAYQLGYRVQPLANLSLSVSTFYNRYDDLRSIEPQSSTEFLPLKWGNGLKGHTYGVEAWGKWQLTDWWRLAPGVRFLHRNLAFKDGAVPVLNFSQAGNDPSRQALLTSSMDIFAGTSVNLTFRHVGALPEPRLPSYRELDAAIIHAVTPNLDLSLSGFNLLHDRHLEYPAPSGEYIRRRVIGQIRWTF